MARTLILKNTTGGDLTFSGIVVPAAGQNEGTVERELLIRDTALRAAITAGDIVVNDGSTDLGAARGLTYLDGIFPQLSRHNGDSTQTFGTVLTTMLFETNLRTDEDAFTYNSISGGPTTGGTVTIEKAGVYRITYEISADNTTGGRTTSQHELQLNGTLIAGSRSWGYHRNTTQGRATSSASVIVSLSAADVIRVRSQTVGSGTVITVANGCRLNIESIDGP